MDINGRKICRLCLKVVANEFVEMDEVMRQMLNILLLNLNLNIIRDPVICRDCVEIAKKCLKFKLTSLDTERIILYSSPDKENAKHDRVLYNEGEYVQGVVDEDLPICRVCMAPLARNNSVSLYTLRNEMMMIEIISGCLPEMDVNIFSYLMICSTCRRNLKCFLKFVLTCLDTQKQINSFYKEQGTDRMDQVNLGNVLYFLCKNILDRPEKCPQTYTNKEELLMLEDKECVYPEAYSGSIKLEELDIKEEIYVEANSYMILPDMESYMLDKETVSDTISLETRSHDTKKKSYQQKVQTNITIGNSNYEDFKRHMLVHKDVSEIKIHKCPSCAYETKYKSNLKSHMLVHKDVSEVKMYKCSLCTYEAKDKHKLKKHLVVHKDISEIKMHRCSFCTYESKYKGNLKMHILVHTDASEMKMIKCSLCAYKTRYKNNLEKHILVHKDLSEINTYKCSLCTYQAKYKHSLQKHILVHKDATEIKMLKCSLCTYECKYKSSLKTHILIHKDVSEIKMHRCFLCGYEAKRKSCLTRHMLVHKKRLLTKSRHRNRYIHT